jgi:formylglycine-generating enzyme required for sulfatase activity
MTAPMTTAAGVDRVPRSGAELDTVVVGEGVAWIGADRPSEGPAVQVDVPAFRIARLAVTNAQYSHFIVAGGYRNPVFWSKEGLTWKRSREVDRPAYWDDGRFNHPMQPVTGVSFFEAEAFARFVHGRLPTEIEWEKAARGCDGRTYPWGEDEPDLSCAYFAPGFVPIESTTRAADDLPRSDSPWGCRQMAGNLFEWCVDPFHEDAPARRRSSRAEQRPSSRRVLKGGAWHTGASRLRASARWSFTPDLRDNVVGFRVVFDGFEQ